MTDVALPQHIVMQVAVCAGEITEPLARELMTCAFKLAEHTPAHLLERQGALAVGAFIIDTNNRCFSTFSGADNGLGHAEELLFQQMEKAKTSGKGALLVVTHEPCLRRTDPNRISCAQHIVKQGVGTVIYSIDEVKPAFRSTNFLISNGIRVIKTPTPL